MKHPHLHHLFVRVTDWLRVGGWRVRYVSDSREGYCWTHSKEIGIGENEIKACVRQMVKDNILRMKEDSVDHDWAYRKGGQWDVALESQGI